MLKEHAPSIPAENITAMTRLDHNRALAQVMAAREAGTGAGALASRSPQPDGMWTAAIAATPVLLP